VCSSDLQQMKRRLTRDNAKSLNLIGLDFFTGNSIDAGASSTKQAVTNASLQQV